jgi:predicted amidohydrolase
MGSRLRIALGQLNLLVGDVPGNAAKMIATAQRARDELKAHVVVFPELALTGYPPEDLLLRPDLTVRVELALGEMLREISGIDVIVGYPNDSTENFSMPRRCCATAKWRQPISSTVFPTMASSTRSAISPKVRIPA